MRLSRMGGQMQQGGPGGSGAGVAPTPPRQPPTTEELAGAICLPKGFPCTGSRVTQPLHWLTRHPDGGRAQCAYVRENS
jgi:hypothetical protein